MSEPTPLPPQKSTESVERLNAEGRGFHCRPWFRYAAEIAGGAVGVILVHWILHREAAAARANWICVNALVPISVCLIFGICLRLFWPADVPYVPEDTSSFRKRLLPFFMGWMVIGSYRIGPPEFETEAHPFGSRYELVVTDFFSLQNRSTKTQRTLHLTNEELKISLFVTAIQESEMAVTSVADAASQTTTEKTRTLTNAVRGDPEVFETTVGRPDSSGPRNKRSGAQQPRIRQATSIVHGDVSGEPMTFFFHHFDFEADWVVLEVATPRAAYSQHREFIRRIGRAIRLRNLEAAR